MSNSHAVANERHNSTAITRTRTVGDRQPAANEPTAKARTTPRHSREPFDTDGPATCLVWF